MIRYICKNYIEVDYCIEKFDLKFEHYELYNIYNIIDRNKIISLSDDSSYCLSDCYDCCVGICNNGFCEFESINIKNIMREEKLKNLLDENY